MDSHQDSRGSLQHLRRFDPDARGDVEAQARAYLNRVGRPSPGYQVVEWCIGGLITLLVRIGCAGARLVTRLIQRLRNG